MSEPVMLKAKDWKTFQESGLLWWTNRMLHLFGWAIVLVQEKDGSISSAYPARCAFRGFAQDQEEEGFIRLTGYLDREHNELMREALGESLSANELRRKGP